MQDEASKQSSHRNRVELCQVFAKQDLSDIQLRAIERTFSKIEQLKPWETEDRSNGNLE